MARTSIRNIDVSQLLRRAGAQFSGLDRRDPSSWPVVPRYSLYMLISALVVGLLWFVWLTDVEQELETERTREASLRTDYEAKLQKAVSLEELNQQRVQVMQRSASYTMVSPNTCPLGLCTGSSRMRLAVRCSLIQ